jgi:hypothetical protein
MLAVFPITAYRRLCVFPGFLHAVLAILFLMAQALSGFLINAYAITFHAFPFLFSTLAVFLCTFAFIIRTTRGICSRVSPVAAHSGIASYASGYTSYTTGNSADGA